MTDLLKIFTSTDLIAAASDVLTVGGYRQIIDQFSEWNTSTTRLFEDEYNIVGVVVFDTCSDLLHAWPDLQESLVTIISKSVGKQESKSWDGYLVLLTPGLAPSEYSEIEAVRYNTLRLRKIVATGDDMQSPTEVDRALRLLMPLENETGALRAESALELLPLLLSEQGISQEVSQILIDAYQDQSPLLEALHQGRVNNEN